MKPLNHAVASTRKHGGNWEDYIAIHEFIDSSKQNYADIRHRAIFHNTLGPYVAARIFGESITNSDGKLISVRQIAEDHIVEDLGCIPPVERWLRHIPREPWQDVVDNTYQKSKRKDTISYD